MLLAVAASLAAGCGDGDDTASATPVDAGHDSGAAQRADSGSRREPDTDLPEIKLSSWLVFYGPRR